MLTLKCPIFNAAVTAITVRIDKTKQAMKLNPATRSYPQHVLSFNENNNKALPVNLHILTPDQTISRAALLGYSDGITEFLHQWAAWVDTLCLTSISPRRSLF